MWTSLLDSTRQLNIYVSFAMFLMGLGVWLFGKPNILSRGFAKAMMILWLAQWCALTGMYILMLKSPTSEFALLLFSDLQSLLVVAAAWSLFEGDRLSWKGITAFCVVLLIFLVLWNGYYYPTPAQNGPTIQRVAWLAPSETLAALALPLLGLAMFIRYHRYGLPFLILTVIYGGFQQAAYSATLLNSADVSQAFPATAPLFFALAMGKVLIGAAFYGMFFLALDEYATVVPPLREETEDSIRTTMGTAVRWLVTSIVVPVFLGVLGTVIGGYLTKK